MRSSHTLVRQRTLFDDPRLIADAGLLLPATLARQLGLAELLERHVDLGAAAGRANTPACAAITHCWPCVPARTRSCTTGCAAATRPPKRAAAGFVTETINRVRRAGAAGHISLRADAGFYARSGGQCLPPRLNRFLLHLSEEAPHLRHGSHVDHHHW